VIRHPLIAGALVGALQVTRPAEAHLVTTGLGPIYDGVGHLLVSPEDLVPVLALALLAGLNGPTAGRTALFFLTAAWLVGGVAGAFVGAPWISSATTAGSFLVLGILTAVDRRLSPALVATLAVAAGLLHGWLNGVALVVAGREALGLVGIVGTIFVLVTIAAAVVVSRQSGWARVASRVAGSWVAAIGLLMVGWAFRGL